MLVSEAEARTEKWCPFNRQRLTSHGEAPAANRTGQGSLIGTCVGSQCMAWRWASPNLGYCGLAGRVE